jgi:hypothetical protein
VLAALLFLLALVQAGLLLDLLRGLERGDMLLQLGDRELLVGAQLG